MNGLFGYTGKALCRDRIANGLCRMAQRANEMSGIAVKGEDGIAVFRLCASPQTLKEKEKSIKNEGYTGIGVCKTATRVRASVMTAVPAADERFALASDGEIDNYETLKAALTPSAPAVTEEELLLAITEAENGDILRRLAAVGTAAEGNPSLLLISAEEDALYCRAGNSPLYIGVDAEGTAVASELAALDGAKRYTILTNGELAKLTAEKTLLLSPKLKRIKKPLKAMPTLREEASPCEARDALLCLPLAVRETLNTLIKDGVLSLGSFQPTARNTERTARILLTGSGAAERAVQYAADYFEELCDLPCAAYAAGDLCAAPRVFDKSTLLVAVSRRGEEPELLACVRRAKRFGAKTLAVTGNGYSSLAQMSDSVIPLSGEYPGAGSPLCCFTEAVLALELTALALGYARDTVSEVYLNVTLKIAEMLPGKLSSAMKPSPALQRLSESIRGEKPLLLCGLGDDGALCAQGAACLAHFTDSPVETLPLCELVHRDTAWLRGRRIIAFLTNGARLAQALRYLRRLLCMGAEITVIASANTEESLAVFSDCVLYSDSLPPFHALTAIACLARAAADAAADTEAINTAG